MPRSTHRPHRTRRRGFTLVELLIVVVIIGLLVAMLAPSWTKTVGKANTSALRADLHNLVVAQEQYFYENQNYSNDVVALKFTATKNVTVTFTSVAPGGWAATATHAHANPIICGVFVGNAPKPLASTVADGQIGCQ